MSAVLSLAEVRQRFDAALIAAEFHRSAYLYGRFGDDTDQLMAAAFAVGLPESDLDPFDGRDRFGTEGEADSTVGVKVAYRVALDDQTGSEDAAMDQEARVIETCLDLDTSLLHVRPVRREIEVTRDGRYLISTITFRVRSRFSFGRP